MILGICKLVLLIRENHSLKGKRQVLRKIKDRISSKFKVSIAEVADNDLWQRAQIGFAVVSNDPKHAESQLTSIVKAVEELYVAEIIDEYSEIMTIKGD